MVAHASLLVSNVSIETARLDFTTVEATATDTTMTRCTVTSATLSLSGLGTRVDRLDAATSLLVLEERGSETPMLGDAR